MKLRPSGIGPLLVASAVWTGWAQSPEHAAPVLTEEPRWQSICQNAFAQTLPPGAAALAAEANSASCNETQAYYGFAKPPDYAEAFRCAYQHRGKPGDEVGSFAAVPGTLAMLYANGYAVQRNYELAIRFACEMGENAASAETELRIGRLEALRDGKLPRTRPFDLCDDAVSGAMGSYCEEITQKLADVGRVRRLEELRDRLPERARALLPELEAAETAFERARGEGEYTGGGGSGSAGFMELDQGHLREQFLINLQRFAAGDLPNATAADRNRAEQEMQGAFDLAQRNAQPANSPNRNLGAPDRNKVSLARTQQAWEALFATWMRFVPVAYPKLSPDSAATELLRLRTHQLTHLSL